MIGLCGFIILPLIDYYVIKIWQNYKINYDTKITLSIVAIMRNQIKLICDITMRDFQTWSTLHQRIGCDVVCLGFCTKLSFQSCRVHCVLVKFDAPSTFNNQSAVVWS